MEIKIKVKVNSRENKMEYDKENNIYKVSLKEKAENNKANLELIKILSRFFKKNARIKRGLKSKIKIIEV